MKIECKKWLSIALCSLDWANTIARHIDQLPHNVHLILVVKFRLARRICIILIFTIFLLLKPSFWNFSQPRTQHAHDVFQNICFFYSSCYFFYQKEWVWNFVCKVNSKVHNHSKIIWPMTIHFWGYNFLFTF